MTEHKAQAARKDVDILEDVQRVFNTYPPLLHDRSRVEVNVKDGAVTATGYVKTAQARMVFKREAEKINGVKSVDVSEVYDDDTLRVQVGQATPFGVFANASYGAVVLSGELPEGTTADALVKKVENMPGVRKAIPNFK